MTMLAVIPARGGSKGLPGKNIRPFLGMPLIAHTIKFAKLCPEIDHCVVSTDSTDIATVAMNHGGVVPSLRPPELAKDDTPLWPVLQHVLTQEEQRQSTKYDLLLLLDPTSPARELSDVSESIKLLEGNPEADGVIGVSKPDFNPIWNCVVYQDGWMTRLINQGGEYDRRQDVPTVYRINGSLYLWRTEFMRSQQDSWLGTGQYLMHEIPEARAMSIDTSEQFERAELLVEAGHIRLPWIASMPNKETGSDT